MLLNYPGGHGYKTSYHNKKQQGLNIQPLLFFITPHYRISVTAPRTTFCVPSGIMSVTI